MPILLAAVPPPRAAADVAAAPADAAGEDGFDRHLDAAGGDEVAADARLAPATDDAERAEAPTSDAEPLPAAPEEPVAEVPAERALAEVLALVLPAVVAPPPAVDPLADAPAAPTLPVAVVPTAPLAPALAMPAAPLPPTSAPLPTPAAPAPARPAAAPAAPASATSLDDLLAAAADPAAAALPPPLPADGGIAMTPRPPTDAEVAAALAIDPPAPAEAAPDAPVDSVLAMLAAVAAAPVPGEGETPTTADVAEPATDPIAAATTAEPAASAPPLASARPRQQAFERDAAPEAILPERADAPTAPVAGPATAAEASPAVPPAAGERAPVAPVRAEAATPPPSASADPGRAANAMDRAVAGQVSRAMLTRGAGGERMLVLRLTPPELGTVRVEIIERAGALSARLHAEDDAVRGALERSLPQLRQDLRAHDAPLREVALADAWNGFDRQGRHDPSGDRPRQRRDDGAPAFSIDGAAPIAAPTVAAALGGIANALGVDARA